MLPSPLRGNHIGVHSFPNGIIKSSPAGTPLEISLALVVSRLLQGIEPGDIVNHRRNSVRELPHRSERQIVHIGRQGQTGNAALYRGNRHSIENIVECFELKAATGSLGNDTHSYATKNRPQVLYKTEKPRRAKAPVCTQMGRNVADDP